MNEKTIHYLAGELQVSGSDTTIDDALIAASDLIKQLRAENERLRQDKRRLDWLQQQREDIVQPTMPYGEPDLIACGWGVQAQAMCVREAIDESIELENTNAN